MDYITYVVFFLMALGLTVIAYPLFIPFLHKLKYGQTVSEYMPSQAKKTGTPTMGGLVFIIIPVALVVVMGSKAWADPKLLMVVLAYVGYGIIGFIDDYIIVVTKNNEGIRPKTKFLLQVLLAAVFYLLYQSQLSTTILIPILNVSIPLGGFYIVFVLLVFASATNAVNLTDGMDGLAGGTVTIALIPFLLFAIQAKEYYVALFILCVIGSLLGYLNFNFFPARIFMGDCGSLALGGLLAALGLLLKQELTLIIIGGVFVIETASVILQIASVKIRKKRIFKCSPIHYHFEQSGMNEQKVVLMFYVFGIIFAVIGYFIGV